MKIVLDILRFREDYLPGEDRYEYSVVAALGGDYIEISVSEAQLAKALSDYAEHMGTGEPEAIPKREYETWSPQEGQEPLRKATAEEVAVWEAAEEKALGWVEEHANGSAENRTALVDALQGLMESGAIPPGRQEFFLNVIATIQAGEEVQIHEEEGEKVAERYQEGQVMDAPQTFYEEQDPHTYAAEDNGLEEALDFGEETAQLGQEASDEVVSDLLAEALSDGHDRPLVDEILVGSEPMQLPEDGPTTSAVFGEAPEPEDPGPRRDMTPGHKKRRTAIKKRAAGRKPQNTHKEKLARMRAKAKQHPMRMGGGADEAGNPLVQPRAKTRVPQAPAFVPGGPEVRRTVPSAPKVQDEDGFPQA